MGALSVAPVSGPLGAEVRGIDLRDPLCDEELEVVIKSSHRYLVLIF